MVHFSKMEEELIPNFSVQEFSSFLAEKFDEGIAAEFEKNKISGPLFLNLTENHLGKMVSAIGDIVELKLLQCRVKERNTQTIQV